MVGVKETLLARFEILNQYPQEPLKSRVSHTVEGLVKEKRTQIS